MNRLTRDARSSALIAAALIVLAGCGEEPGTPTPTSGTQPASQAPNTTSSGSTGPAADALETMNPCDLLTAAEASRMGERIESRGLMGTKDCSWRSNPSVGLDKFLVFGITLRPGQTLDQISVRGNATVTTGQVGQRRAKNVAENDGAEGSCLLVFEVDTGRVDITVESKNTERSCKVASDVSTIIDPRLPK